MVSLQCLIYIVLSLKLQKLKNNAQTHTHSQDWNGVITMFTKHCIQLGYAKQNIRNYTYTHVHYKM